MNGRKYNDDTTSRMLRHPAAYFMMGFQGTEVTESIRCLIADQGLGAVLITQKNIIDAEQATRLISELQGIAQQAGHLHPLLIATDQENGPVNSIFDPKHMLQFPSAMGVAACESPELVSAVVRATAEELACVGVNWVLGPVLDVLGDVRSQPLGVRAAGHDPGEVARVCRAMVRGIAAAGLATCGKHFPSYGNLSFHGSALEKPIVSESMDDLRRTAFVPVKAAIASGLDSMLVGACSMPLADGEDVQHACLSEKIVSQILCQELGFDGVVLSECLEVESMFETLGVGQATVMALQAGCNMLMVCNSYEAQLDAIAGFRLGLESGMVPMQKIQQCLDKITNLKLKVTSWDKALNPGGVEGLNALSDHHRLLSLRAYEGSITLVRDLQSALPFPTEAGFGGELLLLTPLMESPYRLRGEHSLPGHLSTPDVDGSGAHFSSGPPDGNGGFLPGEMAFKSLGLALARRWPGKVCHSSYTATGLRPTHEELIASADRVVVVTADSVRNSYQYGLTKYVATLCGVGRADTPVTSKPCVVVAVGSPYDFLRDESISTYVCTYDFTEPALDALVRVLFGEIRPTGRPPQSRNTAGATAEEAPPLAKIMWLVQEFDVHRDRENLVKLLARAFSQSCAIGDRDISGQARAQNMLPSLLISSNEEFDFKAFVVRNSSTGALYGFCLTSFFVPLSRGSIPLVLVDPRERGRGIGRSMMEWVIRHLHSSYCDMKVLQLDSGVPRMLPAFEPAPTGDRRLPGIVARKTDFSLRAVGRTEALQLADLHSWNPPVEILGCASAERMSFSLAQGSLTDELRAHVQLCSQSTQQSQPSDTLNEPEVLSQLYELAARDGSSCNIILAHKPLESGHIVASALLYSSSSHLSSYVPTPASNVAGLAGILVGGSCAKAIVLRQLVTAVVTMLKKKAFSGLFVTLGNDPGSAEDLERIGFQALSSSEVLLHVL